MSTSSIPTITLPTMPRFPLDRPELHPASEVETRAGEPVPVLSVAEALRRMVEFRGGGLWRGILPVPYWAITTDASDGDTAVAAVSESTARALVELGAVSANVYGGLKVGRQVHSIDATACASLDPERAATMSAGYEVEARRAATAGD